MNTPATFELAEQILEAWETLCESGHECLTASDVLEYRPNLAKLVKIKPQSLKKADEQINKLKAFDSQFLEFNYSDLDIEEALADHFCELESGMSVHVESELTIEREINRGGTGLIYTAKERMFKRRVAVKTGLKVHVSEAEQKRFKMEAILTAQLNHPGITQLYGIGTTEDGLPCYTMRLIEGKPLSELIVEHHKSDSLDRKELKRLLRCFVTVCRTLQYVHDQGVVHCDVKPQNVSVGTYGETVLLDWGEAVSLNPRVKGHSVHQGRITPSYAAPDLQLGHRPAKACDTFSAGMMLAEILVGSPTSSEVKPQLFKNVPAALVSIVSKAVQKKSSDRYHRIEQLADDVEAWIGFDPVSVHNDNAKDWFVRSFSRYDTLARIAVIGSTLFLASLIAAIWLLTLANNSQRIAKKNGLLFAAGVASDRVADEFRFRLDALEDLSKEIADSKELSACMQPTESTGDWQDSQIHGWLQKRIEGDLSFPIHASVFVLSRGGIQIAKHSGHENCNGVLGSLGKNFSHRSYFASNSEGSNGSIIDAPHLSRWYLSSTSKNKIRIALSCPVKNENDKILGVVGLSLNLDDLSFVRRRLVSGQQFSIVDLRPGESKTKPNIGNSPGLIAYHPGYQLKIQSEGVLQEFQFIGSQQVGDMLDVRSRRLNQFANTDSHQPLGLLDNFVSSYSDSVTGANEQKMAYEPIIVRHGDGWIDSGLVVLVQEE